MKKRLISLLVALCMAVTLLPVSAITAWAEESSQLKIVGGYPVGSGENHDRNCSGDGWSYDGSTQTLTLNPSTPTTYDLTNRGSIRLDSISILCSAIIGEHATIENGNFWYIQNPDPSITNDGTITSGVYDMPVINHGTITGGLFSSSVSNESEGKIENGTFESTVTNNGTIKGGIFQKKPEGGTVASGYTLNLNFQNTDIYTFRPPTINGLNRGCYIIPNSDHDTSVTILYAFYENSPKKILFPIDVTFGDTNDTPCLLEDWAQNVDYSAEPPYVFSVTFTAPPANGVTEVTISPLTRLVIDENGYPVGTEGGTRDYSGNGWSYNHTDKTLTLNPSTPTSYDFSGEKNALGPLNPDVHLVVESGATVVVPDPKPEPKPEPEPEAPTYTLTVKGGTFTYNGGEAMTSASVPVDAEVKVTLNQSAVPEGMVFDLWAMDEASLLGNPAVAYNEESFTIPAGTVAKDSIVTVEAQYRDATIESEPSILGTAAIIGVAGAGTAVIVWQGYRIGMELYEKYFQPTPEEDAVVEPTLESQMTDPIS